MIKGNLSFLMILAIVCLVLVTGVESKCSSCALALASYNIWPGTDLTSISKVTNTNISNILRYNKQITSQDSIQSGTRIDIPFPCDCIHGKFGEFLGHIFTYRIRSGDTYNKIAGLHYANLTNAKWIESFNRYNPVNLPDSGVDLNVTVNCSCGDATVSKDFGLFVTYPLSTEDSLESVAKSVNLTEDLIQRYNPGANFSSGTGLVYLPGRDDTGNYPPFKSSSGGLAFGVMAGIIIAGIAVLFLVGACIYVMFNRKKQVKNSLNSARSEYQPVRTPSAPRSGSEKAGVSAGSYARASPGLAGITVEKSVEFSYKELAKATNDFDLSFKIGQGGFGAVYYAELRGEKAAIKKMDMKASREFLAELNVLTHVHHLNLVRLIGYCVEGSLFLVYEYIENGNLNEHLHGKENKLLPWSTRVQIALDSARGLEYIHEHTVPVYIHRDIKSANILIDKNYHGKVADFGLTKLTEVGSTSNQTRLVGTFGYMPPEYAQYGDVSPKVDVYAFGVVLYELISAKNAIAKASGSVTESKGLVALFDEALSHTDLKDGLRKLVDQRLGDDYPLDEVHKMAQLAQACTQENPQLRPSMRSIVVALMTLSSSTEDWDADSFYKNQALINLMSGR